MYGPTTTLELIDTELCMNRGAGIYARYGGRPILAHGNTVRDHARGREPWCGVGLYVEASARGCPVGGEGNIFIRNEEADIFRK